MTGGSPLSATACGGGSGAGWRGLLGQLGRKCSATLGCARREAGYDLLLRAAATRAARACCGAG
jgi:hypothetical protein